MSTILLKISDGDGQLDIEGQLDPDAMNGPPTPALIVGTYLAANMGKVCQDAVAWSRAQQPEPSQIIVPGGATA